MRAAMLRTLVASVFVWLWASSAFAQGVPLSGRVVDAQGGTVNGALVTLTASEEPGVRSTRTGVDGTFAFEAVSPRPVALKVEAAGFESWDQTVTVRATAAPLTI